MTKAARPLPVETEDDFSPDIRQRQASDPAVSAWVNASAGSGKTRVLTNRVTRLLLEGVEPQKILCITFTRAAAAEMSNRVTGMLSHWATCDDNMLSHSLSDLQGYPPEPEQMTAARRLFARVLACPGGMRIRTIHAFGQEILRRFPVEAGLAPHFAVIEERDARLLEEDVLTELLREASSKDSAVASAMKALVADLGERGFREAMRDVLHERTHIKARIAEAGGLDQCIAQIRTQLSLKPDDTSETICRRASDDLVSSDVLLQAGKALQQGLVTAQERGKVILEWLESKVEARAQKFQAYCDVFFKKDGGFHKTYVDKKSAQILPNADEILQREAARLKLIKDKLETLSIAENTAALLIFGSELSRRYEAQKILEAALDYDDLIIKTDALLRRPGVAPWVLYKLDGGLDHILVDEAQDTSKAQWSIVAALADEFFAGSGARQDQNRTLFVVGDEKQSIFSFQNADPEAFASMRGFFADRVRQANKSWREVPMRTSFRSAPAILRAVDHVFASDTARAGVSMEPVEHHAHHINKIGRVEVWPLQKPLVKDVPEEGPWSLPLGYEKEHDPQAELANQIATKIKGWLESGEMLAGERPITAGDIMILLRRRGRFADLMVRALKENAIPVTGVDRMRLTQQLPVMDLLALIQFTLLPEDDLNLATVLRGPLMNLSEDDLMALAMGREGSLWHSLTQKASKNPLFAAIFEYLSKLLGTADFVTPFAMLTRLLNEICPGSKVSGRHAIWSRLGTDALDPVDELLNAAQNFSHRHAPSLQNFLHWLTSTETEIKRELDRSGGQVKIMTVHAAKGLEAPIVFLPDAASVPRTQDVPKFLWMPGDLPLYTARKPTVGAARRLWDVARQKQTEEYRRLLYVALTRAANRLYISGWELTRTESSNDESWYRLITEALAPLHEAAAAQTEPTPGIAFADPELRVAKKEKPAKEIILKKMALPIWATKPAPQEEVQMKSLSPSQLGQLLPATATPDKVFARGRLIHRLLQSLPDMEDGMRDQAAAHFLANPQHNLSSDEQKDVQKEVLDLLRNPVHAALFGINSRAEVPLAGYVGGKPITGQVDRLCIQGNEIWIVDYKTNRPPPDKAEDAPLAYRQQLAAYRTILQAIYPGKTVRCYLLWTYGARLMEMSAD